ncbi:MAG TPA: PAS domain S-box protein [Thermoanaerobaculia bacterium]|nr:PAS domain S-box protein [Thermoanaerobaculia bacterium]
MLLPDGTIDFVNVAAAHMAGAEIADVVGAPFQRFVHADDLPRALAAFTGALAGHASEPIDVRVVQPGGALIVVEATMLPERRGGAVAGVFGIAREVTARRAAEEASRKRERQLAEAQRLAQIGNWDLDLVTGELQWSDEMYRIYGLDPAVFPLTFAAFLERVHPADRARIVAYRTGVNEGETLPAIEFRIVRPDGSIRNILGRVTLYGAGTAHPKLFGASQDVTELRRIELDLRRRERQFAVAQTFAEAASYEVDYDTGEITWSDELYAQLGYSKDVVPSTEAFAARLHADDAERVLSTYRRAFAEQAPCAHDYRIVRSDGEIRAIHSQAFPVVDAEGRARKFVGVAQDVTSRRAMEIAAAESRQRLQAIFDNALDAIVLVDDDGRCVDANPAACRLAGTSREALSQRKISDCIAELEGVTASSGELTARLHDGAMHDIEYRAVDSIVPGLHLLILRDISDRKRAEREVARGHARQRALARRVTERHESERQRIARELHDEIAQMMTAVMLGLQSVRNITGDRNVLEKIEESVEIVESSLERARGLSLELRPAILDDLGLVAALRWYLDRQRERGGWNVRFKSRGIADTLRGPVCMACFRVAQEAVANVARHANARQLDVELIGGDGAITLRIADDGVGFDVDSANSSADHGLGLLGMQERVLLLGGEFRVRSQRGAGTEVTARFPVKEHS